jgi:putative oxygen-independent coproporphyrinogen III oxidase
MSALTAPPLSLYVHMPWCVRKCPYCDFNSHVAPDRIPERAYVAALLDDIEQDLPLVAGRKITSIFFGGGTPSLFAPDAIDELLAGVRSRVPFDSGIEVTLEANPGTIEHGRFAGYKAAGVTRVSLGAQTFDEQRLRVLGRIHSAGDIHHAVDELSTAGLTNFNIDLMYALPGQQVEEAVADLETALALNPSHISHYQLTLEPGTVFYHRPPSLPDQDASWDMQVACQAVLTSHGFDQYEVSAYAHRGRECRHNLNYWRFGDYIGIGAGAHGKMTDAANGQVVRTVRHRQPREYLRQAGSARLSERRIVAANELPLEFALNALRLTHGFSSREFEDRTGIAQSSVRAFELAQNKGLLGQSGNQWLPTELGRRFLNDLQALFLPEATGSQRSHRNASAHVPVTGTAASS